MNTENKEEAEALKSNITKLKKGIQILKASQRNEIEIAVLRTIAAFMNSRGGILLVGVKNNGYVSGIEVDYELFSDADVWTQHLKSLISLHIGKDVMMNIEVKIVPYCGKTVAIVQVRKSLKPIFMEYELQGDKKIVLFIRALNTTEPLDPKDYRDYFRQNWND